MDDLHPQDKERPESSSTSPIVIQSSTPPLFALIIGINEYADSRVNNLTAAVTDAEAVSEFLLSTLGVPAHQIKMLRNKEATRDTIQGEIMNLADNPAIKEGDAILIYYAGHGAETSAPSGWPTDSRSRMIQMLLPHDFSWSGSVTKQGQGVLDITFARLLANLARNKSDNITVILDCCHSGSGTRKDKQDKTFEVRGVELPKSYTIPGNLLHDTMLESRASSIPKGFENIGLTSHVLLAACKQGQEAREKFQCGGEFTLALLSLLREQGVDELTYNDVITLLPNLPQQNPQCEGVHQNRFLFNSKISSPRRQLFGIRSKTPGQLGKYILEAGEAQGIGVEAELVVYPDKSMTFPLGTVVTSHTTAFTALCTVPQHQTPFALDQPGFALQIRVGERKDVRFCIREADSCASLKRVVEEMENEQVKGRVRLVNSTDDRPDLAITTENGLVYFEIMDPVCRKYGLERMPFAVSTSADDTYLKAILQSAVDFYWHLRRSRSGKNSGPTGPPPPQIKLECFKLKWKFTDDFEEFLVPDEGDNLYDDEHKVFFIDVNNEGPYGFQITNDSTTDFYIWMFYFDLSDLSIDLYYQPGSAAEGKADISLPAGQSLTIGYGSSGTSPHSYRLRDDQDVDVGYLKLFLTEKYVDFSDIVQKSPFDQGRQSRLGIKRLGIKRVVETSFLWATVHIAIVQK
ncbi:hypothetical protein GYMLUDRAFT_43498 [Collybiopsis luxurians FD-317 M1]|uniref:Peptidase C14 caspase domain-containing protein n=1 Tax=Collybiopsis luxurians FD-317 M1 TaxID=944289 RepID=A0A0D0BYQ5_9AGAR|nr:hypothetical protein GYMLUDRAFT_43498 [Collybiopsis luxurians FD-317 M1]